MRRQSFLFFIFLIVAASPAFAADIAGRASVIDGDTLEIAGQRFRLFGVDAPESAQTCNDMNGNAWRCGQKAALALSNLIGQKTVACTPVDRDRYGRTVARCRSGGTELNDWMVENGWARAYTAYSKDYLGAESAARQRAKNIWAGEMTAPWQYRKDKRGAAMANRKMPQMPSAPTGSCAIKGNIGASGACIYHLPGMRDYAKVRITASRGERFYCSELEAIAAGCRRAKR